MSDDDELRSRMQHGARPLPTDAEAELAALRPRFHRARRRRQAVMGLASSATVVALFVVGLAVFGGEDAPSTVVVADEPGVTTSVPATSTSIPTPSTSMAPSTTAVPTPTTTTPATGHVGRSTRGHPTTTAPPDATPPPAAPSNRTVTAAGGTVTFSWTPTSLRAADVTPIAGWQVEEVRQDSPTRVVVRFRRDQGGPGSSNSTVDARVVDGELQVNL